MNPICAITSFFNLKSFFMTTTTRLLLLATMAIGITSCSKDKAVQKAPESCNCEERVESYHTTSKRVLTTGLLNGTEITYEKADGLNLFEGDILLTDEQLAPSGSSTVFGTGVTSATKKWPNKTVYYTYAAGLSAATITKFQNAANHWTNKTGFIFTPRTTQADYIEVIEGDGCYSNLGRTGGKQQLSIALSCSAGNAAHEIGHAIGLFHEHTRRDRDDYVIVNTANAQAGTEHNFTKRAILGGFDQGTLDFGSMMMYASNAFSSNGNPTITKLDGTTFTAQRSTLSVNDVATVAVMYP